MRLMRIQGTAWLAISRECLYKKPACLRYHQACQPRFLFGSER